MDDMWQQCSQLSALDAAHHYGHLTFSWANHPEHWPVPFIGLALIAERTRQIGLPNPQGSLREQR
jgi:hypothetical protein